MREYKDINPLSVVNDALKEAQKWNLIAEVVLLALKLVKNNPDIDEATAILIARDEQKEWAKWDAKQQKEINTEVTDIVSEADKTPNKFSKHVVNGYHEDIFNDDDKEEIKKAEKVANIIAKFDKNAHPLDQGGIEEAFFDEAMNEIDQSYNQPDSL